MKNTYLTNEFINKANLKHNNKYNYSKAFYVNNRTKVIIICPEHGEFLMTPNNHLTGKGCSKCSGRYNYTTEEFIDKANKVHNFKFDYSKVNYKNTETKIVINCKHHGDFEQIPNNHLQGAGCPNCFGNKKLNDKEFIEKAIEKHEGKYNYAETKYINNRTKIIIICKEHGKFLQTPSSHLNGNGCPNCNSSKGELTLEAIFKKFGIEFKQQYRVPEVVSNYEIDFYLPRYRLLVEFHGIQHYNYIPFFHDNGYTLSDQKRRDEMVRDYAIRFKYRYLEFNYKQLKHLTKEQFEEMVISKIDSHFLTNIRRTHHDC